MRKIVAINFVILISLFTVACEQKVPIDEMVKAKQKITEAYNSKAEKYDKKNLDLAIKELNDSHTLIIDEKDDDSLSLAKKSKVDAQKAIDTSMPLWAKDEIAIAQEKFDVLLKLNGDNFFKEKYDLSSSLLSESKNFNKDKKYRESIKKSLKSNKMSLDIESECMGKKVEMHSELSELNDRLESLKKLDQKGTQGKKIALITTSSQDVNKLLEDTNLREAYPKFIKLKSDIDLLDKDLQVNNLIAMLDELNKNIESLKPISEKNRLSIEDVKKQIIVAKENILKDRDLEKGKGAFDKISESIKKIEQEIIKEEYLSQIKVFKERLEGKSKVLKGEDLKFLDKIAAKIGDLKGSVDKGEYEKAHLMSVAINEDFVKLETLLLQRDASLLLAKAQKQYDSLKENKKLLNNVVLKNAETLIKDGNGLLEDSKFPESISKADSAIKIMLKLANLSEKTNVKKDSIKIPKEKLYTVKYKKNDTDCLWKIALRQYKDAKLWTVIYIANRKTIKNPDLIFPGQKLKIPSKPIAKKNFKKTRKEVNSIRKRGAK